MKTKELTPREAFDNVLQIICSQTHNDNLQAYINCVDNALKEKEQQDDVLKILKETIAFSQTLPYIEPNKDNGFDIMSAVQLNIQRDIENKKRKLLRQWVLETCFPKELKALDILKKCCLLSKHELAFTNKIEISQEEYDLLKEVLGDD